MSPGVRDAVVVHLFESAAVGRLNAAVAEQLGEIYRDIVAPVQFSEAIYAANPRFRTWDRIKNLLSRLDPNEPRANLQANALAAAFARKELATPEDAESAFRAFVATDIRLRGTTA